MNKYIFLFLSLNIIMIYNLFRFIFYWVILITGHVFDMLTWADRVIFWFVSIKLYIPVS